MIPQNYGIVNEQPSPISQRSLTLVAKILQALANNLPFQKKEEPMMYFNPLLEQSKPEYSKFLEILTQVPPDTLMKTPKFSTKPLHEAVDALEKELILISRK